MNGKKKGIGFSFAWNGLTTVIKSERNFQIHLIATFLVISAGIFFSISFIEWTIVTLVIGLVLVTELINSAIEKTIDYLKPDIHPAAKLIKDIAAGAVLVSAITSVIIGMILFLPKFYSLFN